MVFFASSLMPTRPVAPAISIRPLRHLIDLWLVAALFIAIKCVSATTDKAPIWGISVLGLTLAAVWLAGRSGRMQSFFSVLLNDAPADERHTGVANAPISSKHHTADLPVPSTISVSNLHHRCSARAVWFWCFGGFAMIAALFAALEVRQPLYFVEDDNLSQFLPVVLQGCRSLLTEGVFPTWNPHQFLGSPTTSLGTYALTYPPTYMSYAIARWIVGNEAATFEVFCIGHLLVGYLAAFWACRVMQIRPSLAASASACFAISGFFLIAGRSWYYMTPTAAWMPVLVGLLELLRRREVGWKWVLATGIALGALFHSGNAQMWCYAVLMFGIALCLLMAYRALPITRIIAASAGLLLGIAISLPLLVPQYLETAKLERSAGDSTVLRCLPSMVLPFPLAHAEYPGVTQTPHFDHMGHLFYSGTLFSVIAILAMLSLVAHRWSRHVVTNNLWLVLAWVALILALGRVGGLWYVLSKVPPFNGFKHAFKFIPFVTLFMMLGGALVIERALRHWPLRRRYLEVSIPALVALLLGYHAWMSTCSFCDYGCRPYAQPPAEMQALNNPNSPARMYAIGPRRSLAPEYGFSMMHQLPSVWGWYAFEGYDPLVRRGPRFGAVMDKLFAPAAVSGMEIELGAAEIGLEEILRPNKNGKIEDALHRSGMDEDNVWGRNFRIDLAQALKALREYGVRWVVLYTGPQIPHLPEGHNDEVFWRTDPVAEQVGEAVKERGRMRVRDDAVCIYELSGAAPLAFIAGKQKIALPIQFNAAGATVDTSSLTEETDVVVNTMPAPFLKARADGAPATASTDKWGRLVYHLPAGTKQLRLAYQPPWFIGTLLGAALAAFAIAAMRWRDRLANLAARFISRSKSPLVVRLRSAA
jgi:hypothetical protein